jgi:hypothetical protein
MKRTTLLAAALLLSVAPFASANAKIMAAAKAKDPKITKCMDCHTKLPGTKDNLTEVGKKWVAK